MLENLSNISKKPCIDVALQAYGKPWQTVLCLLSLLRHSGDYIGTIYFILEPVQPAYDEIALTNLAKLHPKIKTLMLRHPLMSAESVQMERLGEANYRRSIRYQLAFERSENQYLFITHNDVYFEANILEAMLAEIGNAFAIGEIGQCWNCPAKRQHLLEELNINQGKICARERYQEFTISYEELLALYELSEIKGEHLRRDSGRDPIWQAEFANMPRPLPECRINEWVCLLNLQKVRPLTIPYGEARPFGCYIDGLDLGVAWFRDMHKMGFFAKHFEKDRYLKHFGGRQRMDDLAKYEYAENTAKAILKKDYQEFAELLADRGLNLE